jgi:hypothetical protein
MKPEITDFQQRLARGELTFDSYAVVGCPGSSRIEAIFTEMPMPVGTLYWRFAGAQMLEVLYLITLHFARHAKVGTRLIQELQRQYPEYQIITAAGSKDSGAPFMRATGWHEDPVMGWALKRETREDKALKAAGDDEELKTAIKDIVKGMQPVKRKPRKKGK